MQPEQYEAWYTTARETLIGEEECHPLQALLAPRFGFGETVLGVGCGTGHFTCRFSDSAAVDWTVGADIAFATAHFCRYDRCRAGTSLNKLLIQASTS